MKRKHYYSKLNRQKGGMPHYLRWRNEVRKQRGSQAVGGKIFVPKLSDFFVVRAKRPQRIAQLKDFEIVGVSLIR